MEKCAHASSRTRGLDECKFSNSREERKEKKKVFQQKTLE